MINPHEFRLYRISFRAAKETVSAWQKQLNLRAVRATMPTPHSEGKVNGGQAMNYRANPFQDYELITIDEGRLAQICSRFAFWNAITYKPAF